jgi:hypothetical protein
MSDSVAKISSIQETISKVVQMFTQTVVPLYRLRERNRPEAMGTGLLVHDKGKDFLVSAAHCLEETKNSQGLYFYITPKEWRKVTGRVTVNTWEGDRAQDLIDVGVVKLDGEKMPPYREMKLVAVDSSWLKPKRFPREGRRYAIVGFPSSYVDVRGHTKNIHVQPFAYNHYSIADAEYSSHGIDPEHHIALQFIKRKTFLPDGKQMTAPDLFGLSGSPIFELWGPEERDDSGVFPIVGIGTKHRKSSRIILGTDVSAVLDMIAELHRD